MYGFPVLFISLVITILPQSLNTAWGQLEQLRRPRSLPEAPTVPSVPMATIPEGVFIMGANGTDALEDERPQHEIWPGSLRNNAIRTSPQPILRHSPPSDRPHKD